MHQTIWRATLTIESEDRQIRSVWQNKEKTQTMTSSNECIHKCTVLSAWNERKQNYTSNQLLDWKSSRLNTILYQWKVSFRRFKKWERQDIQQLWQICE